MLPLVAQVLFNQERMITVPTSLFHSQLSFLVFIFLKGEGVLVNYQLVMNLLLRKVSNRHILKTRPPKDEVFAQVCSIEESWPPPLIQ